MSKNPLDGLIIGYGIISSGNRVVSTSRIVAFFFDKSCKIFKFFENFCRFFGLSNLKSQGASYGVW